MRSEPRRDPSYAQTLDWLLHLEVTRGWDLKLESVREALEILQSPHEKLAALHVAGTNGKGSTAAIAEAVLSAHGLRVGLYTSPHLADFRERIRIGADPMDPQAVCDLTAEVRRRLEGSKVELTFFEFTTVIAFLYFARENVDAVVIEVGLGGRLDATNVVRPRAAVVTTVGLDHERYLGSTIAEIAAEKGGILKTRIPAVVGRVDDDALGVLERIAFERESPLRVLGREFRADSMPEGFDYVGRRTIRGLCPALRGRFQIDNAAVALAGLEDGGWLAGIPDDTVRRGVAEVRWPGRLEIVRREPLVVLDGAHNPDGVEALAAEIPALASGRPVRLVFGVLSDKRWDLMAKRLAPLVSDVTVVPVPERRSEDPERVAAAFRPLVPTRTASSGREAIERLLREDRTRASMILVAGSLFLVGEVRESIVTSGR
jgi:dihydrofolate synthase/folylpolyglutamate synthase